MFFRFLAYLKFFLRSTNQHGIHSPFVYNFVTKGLYGKEKIKYPEYTKFDKFSLSKREKKLLYKILNYFEIEGEIEFFNTKIFNLNKHHNYLYINNLVDLNIEILSLVKQVKLILIRGIHRNANTHEKWNKICAVETATATIDLFYFGLVFFRTEQRKEHFIIRS